MKWSTLLDGWWSVGDFFQLRDLVGEGEGEGESIGSLTQGCLRAGVEDIKEEGQSGMIAFG